MPDFFYVRKSPWIGYIYCLLNCYSVEKLRPEKELQRAKTDINRSKSKIRDLFQRLDTMAAEGKFPETLYDSEGLIDSEDVSEDQKSLCIYFFAGDVAFWRKSFLSCVIYFPMTDILCEVWI